MAMKAKRKEKGGLVLSRKVGESFTLFDRRDGSFVPIVVTQEKIQGNRSSLHIDAPEYIGIVRTELTTNGIVLDAKGATESC
jgi:sRNA-binding carbon storage regulator CsrA